MLENGKTLADYNILNEDNIDLNIITKAKRQIFIKTYEGKTLVFEVDPFDTIDMMKQKIQEKIGVPSIQQKLRYNGKFPKGNLTLDSLGVQWMSTLYVVLKKKNGMPIFIKTPAGKKFTIDADQNDTIEIIKNKIQEKEGVLSFQQELRYDDLLLEDGFTLLDYNIHKDTTINLKIFIHRSLNIFIKTLNGKIISLDVEPTDTINIVKEKIEEKIGVPPIQQKMRFFDIVLEGWRTLASYNVQNDSTINAEFVYKNEMQIYVRTVKGDKLTLMVDADDAIAKVKAKIQEVEGTLVAEQELKVGEIILEDGFSLSEYEIQKETTIDLRCTVKGAIQILVICSTGKIISLDTNCEDSVASIKYKIQEKENYKIDNKN